MKAICLSITIMIRFSVTFAHRYAIVMSLGIFRALLMQSIMIQYLYAIRCVTLYFVQFN